MSSYRETDDRPVRNSRPVVSAEECGASEAARAWRPRVQPGMYVLGVSGDVVGQVKEVRAGDFLVDRSGGFGLTGGDPVYLPYERIHAMLGDRITLDIPSDELERAATPRSPFSSTADL